MPVENVFALACGGLLLAAAGFQIYRNQRAGKTAAQDSAKHDAIAAWAQQREWQVSHASDPEVHERVEALADRTGLPADWDLQVGRGRPGASDANFSPALRWQYGSVLTRETARGRLTLCGAHSEDGFQYRVFSALTTTATLPEYTVDVLPRGEPTRFGTPAALGDGAASDVEALVAGLERPARVRLIEGSILVTVAGELSGDVVQKLGDRMIAFEQRLEARPDHGPLG